MVRHQITHKTNIMNNKIELKPYDAIGESAPAYIIIIENTTDEERAVELFKDFPDFYGNNDNLEMNGVIVSSPYGKVSYKMIIEHVKEKPSTMGGVYFRTRTIGEILPKFLFKVKSQSSSSDGEYLLFEQCIYVDPERNDRPQSCIDFICRTFNLDAMTSVLIPVKPNFKMEVRFYPVNVIYPSKPLF